MKNKKYIKYLSIPCIILASLLQLGANESVRYKSIEKLKGIIQAYPEAYKKENIIKAELSAVVANSSHVILFNDKKVKNRNYSPVLALRLDVFDNNLNYIDNTNIVYSHRNPLKRGVKYESASITPDSKYVIAASSFTPTDHSIDKAKRYACLYVWENGNEDSTILAHQTITDGYISSDSLRKRISELLGVDFFNMEGLAVISNHAILLGIRHVGKNSKNCSNVIYILWADFEIDENQNLILSDIRFLYDFSYINEANGISMPLGLSSMEYDPANKRLYMLTSYEVNGGNLASDIGSYLWVLNVNTNSFEEAVMDDMEPILVRNESGEPLYFESKMEGLAIMANGDLLIIADDDGVTDFPSVNRKLNEVQFSIIQIQEDCLN